MISLKQFRCLVLNSLPLEGSTASSLKELIMKRRLNSAYLAGGAVALAVWIALMSTAFAQKLSCITLQSEIVACPFNTFTNVDVDCPAGRQATGGGYRFHEGSLGVINIWAWSLPNGNGWRTTVVNQNEGFRSVQTFVRCCRIRTRDDR
jgi:hypothetical protein